MNSTIIKSAMGTVLGICTIAIVAGLAWLGISAYNKQNKEVSQRAEAVYCQKMEQTRAEENKQFLATHPVVAGSVILSKDINPAAEGNGNSCDTGTTN